MTHFKEMYPTSVPHPRVGVLDTGDNGSDNSMADCIIRLLTTPGFKHWMLIIPLSHLILSYGCPHLLGLWRGETTKKGMAVSHLFSYLIVSTLACTYISFAGLTLMMGLFGVDEQTVIAQNMFYARSPFVERHLLMPMFAYQFWNTMTSFTYKSLCNKTMILHHSATAALQVIGFLPFLHSECFFFIGLAEVTNIPLSWIDACDAKPEWKEQWPNLHSLCQATFASLFLSIRVIIWSFRAIPVWYKLYHLWVAGGVRNNTVAVGFFIISFVLSALQIKWSKVILTLGIGEVKKLMSGSTPTSPLTSSSSSSSSSTGNNNSKKMR